MAIAPARALIIDRWLGSIPRVDGKVRARLFFVKVHVWEVITRAVVYMALL